MIIISSKGSDDETTDAENALQQIAGLILKVMSYFCFDFYVVLSIELESDYHSISYR